MSRRAKLSLAPEPAGARKPGPVLEDERPSEHGAAPGRRVRSAKRSRARLVTVLVVLAVGAVSLYLLKRRAR